MSIVEKVDAEGCLIEEATLQLICDRLDGVPSLSDDIPVPDQDGQTTLKRQGDAGTSDEAARSDHNHDIVRLANPGDPIVTVDGAGVTLGAQVILDRESTEEWYAYKIRVQLTREAGIGWHRILVPQIAGFQQRMITGIGNYRSSTVAPQQDDLNGNQNAANGATPLGPYMGKEWHEWSSTGIIYGGIYRRDNRIGSEWVEFWVKYTCL